MYDTIPISVCRFLPLENLALQATRATRVLHIAKGHVGVIHEPNDLRTEELSVVLGIQIWPGDVIGLSGLVLDG